MPFNFSPPEYLSHHWTRKNRVSPVSRASTAHMNSPSEPVYMIPLSRNEIRRGIILMY